MATITDLQKIVKAGLSSTAQQRYGNLVNELILGAIRTISAAWLWTWREDVTTFARASSNIYEMPSDCLMVSSDGAAVVDSNGNPTGPPLVHLDEREYHFRYDTSYTTGTSSSSEIYYVPLKALSSDGNRQVRIFPNLTSGHEAKVWYFRKVSANEDVKFIDNELMIVYRVWGSMPGGMDKQEKFLTLANAELVLEIDKDMIAARGRTPILRRHPKTKAHNQLMQRITKR